MTFEEFVEHIRAEIREEGFLSEVNLAGLLVKRAHERGLTFDHEAVLEKLPCSDIRIVEYANTLTVNYRRKNLYYYCPV